MDNDVALLIGIAEDARANGDDRFDAARLLADQGHIEAAIRGFAAIENEGGDSYLGRSASEAIGVLRKGRSPGPMLSPAPVGPDGTEPPRPL